jgi:hypothetical protein
VVGRLSLCRSLPTQIRQICEFVFGTTKSEMAGAAEVDPEAVSEGDAQLTYMINIVLAKEFVLSADGAR